MPTRRYAVTFKTGTFSLEGDTLANPPAPAPRPITHWIGRAMLWWAQLLQHTVAGKTRRKQHVARRNAAMRGAHARGIHRDTITQAVGLSHEQVRKALRGEQTSE